MAAHERRVFADQPLDGVEVARSMQAQNISQTSVPMPGDHVSFPSSSTPRAGS